MQGRVPGVQQGQKEEHCVAAVEEDLPFAEMLAVQLERLAVMDDRRLVAAGEEIDSALEDRPQEPVFVRDTGDLGRGLGEASGQEIGLQEFAPEGFVFR